jgi:protein-S-isoprenylcysteine O-methyltransferase Ste14
MSPAARFVMIVLSTALYLGLAILGWGGVAPFLSDPALMALAIATCAMAIAAFFVGGSLSSGVREDRDNRWVLIAFAAIGISGGFLPAFLERIGFLTMDGEGVRWLGVAVYAVGGVLRLWPVHVLGNRFSGLVAIQPGHTLVTNGIYSVIRHPSYLGLILNSLGWALAFRSWVGVALTVLILVPLVARIRAEEVLAERIRRCLRCVSRPHIAIDSWSLLALR